MDISFLNMDDIKRTNLLQVKFLFLTVLTNYLCLTILFTARSIKKKSVYFLSLLKNILKIKINLFFSYFYSGFK